MAVMQDRAATDAKRICALADTARQYLRYVYVGNCCYTMYIEYRCFCK